MKRVLLTAWLCVTAWGAVAADVGVSVSVSQPGFSGRIDIGPYPQPALIYPQPIIIAPGPVHVARAPIYMHVPPGHAKDWRRHCARYQACGQPVYFVQETWYQQVYVPGERKRHGGPKHEAKGRDRSHGPGHGGPGQGRGKGQGGPKSKD